MMDIVSLYESMSPRYPELAGKVALVTGSSQGIGQGIALRLAREGMSIVIHGKDAAQVDEVVQEFQAVGAAVSGITADFSQPDSVDHLFDALQEQHKSLHVLVNNAADIRRTTVQKATTAMLDHQLAVNVRAAYLCSLKAAAMMQSNEWGAIINISSVGGQRAHWHGLPYDMTKGAIDAMTRAMAIDLAGDGIRVNAIAPGAIRTPRSLPADHEQFRAMSARIPAGRMGTVQEIGAVVAFLASEDAAYIVGQVIVVDGGITAQISPPGQPI